MWYGTPGASSLLPSSSWRRSRRGAAATKVYRIGILAGSAQVSGSGVATTPGNRACGSWVRGGEKCHPGVPLHEGNVALLPALGLTSSVSNVDVIVVGGSGSGVLAASRRRRRSPL